jgi:AraC-like DNA-binding protein
MPASHSLVSTDQVPASQAFSFWQEVICDTFIELDCAATSENTFRGKVSSTATGAFQLSSLVSDEIEVTRSRPRIARSREEFCLVVIQGEGRTLAEQDGRRSILRPGDLALFDGARPYYAKLEAGFHHFVLKAAREELSRRLGALERLTVIPVRGDSGIGHMASACVRELSERFLEMPADIAQRAASCCLDLVSTALATGSGLSREARRPSGCVRFLEARALIERHLGRGDVGSEWVAQALKVSPRYLRQLFAENGTSPGRFIWERRLERCRMALADPRQANRSVSEVAFAWGFNDTAHFSRAFRKRFGLSPREYRQSHRGDLTPIAGSVGAIPEDAPSV